MSVEKASKTLKSDDFPIKFIYTTVALCALLPEYIAPIFTLVCFLVFKKHFSLTSQKVKLGTVGKVFLSYMCYSLLSAFWSTTPIYSAAISLLWMGMLLGSFFISNMTTTRERFENLIVCFSIGGGASGGIALIQYIFLMAKIKVPNPLWSILDTLIYKLLPFSVLDTSPEWAATRSASTFDNPLILGTYLVIVFPLAVYGFLGGKKENRSLCGICSLLILSGIISTTSRGPAIAVIASLIILVFLNSKKAVGVVATIASAVGAIALSLSKRNSFDEFDLDGTVNSRFKIWEACIKGIFEKPIFGHGAGCETTAETLLRHGVSKPHAHSLFLETSSELGIFGLVFLSAVFILIFYDIFKLIRVGGIYKRMGISFLASTIGFLIASITEFTLQTPKELQFFMLFLGMIEAAKRLALNDSAVAAQPPKECISAAK